MLREGKGERNTDVREISFCSCTHTDWEWNPQPLFLRDDAPTDLSVPARAKLKIFLQLLLSLLNISNHLVSYKKEY